MGPGSTARLALIERQEGYIGLQLMFAERLAHLWGRPLGEVAANWTNLHRRLALGTPDPLLPHPDWLAFAGELESRASHAARLGFTLDALVRCPEPLPPDYLTRFGCFACEAPDEHGAVRIHFHAGVSDGELGPLARQNVPKRVEELTAMVRHASMDPRARTIAGGSWLYNIEAYRRLFPEAYVASRQPEPQSTNMRGLSMWGQFLTHKGHYRRSEGDILLARLPRLDPVQPEQAFTFRKLIVSAPLTTFQEHFGLALPAAP